MSRRNKRINVEITDAELVSVTPGKDEATGQAVLVLTLRPDINKGFKTINLAIRPDNGVTFGEQLQIALRHPLVKGKFKMPPSIRSQEESDDTEDK